MQNKTNLLFSERIFFKHRLLFSNSLVKNISIYILSFMNYLFVIICTCSFKNFVILFFAVIYLFCLFIMRLFIASILICLKEQLTHFRHCRVKIFLKLFQSRSCSLSFCFFLIDMVSWSLLNLIIILKLIINSIKSIQHLLVLFSNYLFFLFFYFFICHQCLIYGI